MPATRSTKRLGVIFLASGLGILAVWLTWFLSHTVVIDRRIESGTIVHVIERKMPIGKGHSPRVKTFYSAEVRTMEGDTAYIPTGVEKPVLGKRVKFQWREHPDGSTSARFVDDELGPPEK